MVTGSSDALKESITMRSAAGGSSARIESSLVRTSNAAFSASRSQLKRTVNCASSGRAVASISSMPESVASASSTGRTTSCSISSGVEPG